MKTNAARLLDQWKIPYRLVEYAVDVEDLRLESTARKLGVPASLLFKTLVCRGDRSGVVLAVVPGGTELDLKALARASENRTVHIVPLREVQPLTGYVRGGVTALAAKKSYVTYLDDSATQLEELLVSAGRRGTMLGLRPEDYVRATRARLVPGLGRPAS